MATSNTKKISTLIPRIILGLIYFVFGLNFFLHFIPNDAQPEGNAAAFLGGLFKAGYMFPMIKTIEVVAGALLLAGLFVPLLLVMLMPITLNILLFHAVLEPTGPAIAMGTIMLLCQLYLAWVYRDQYKHLFIARSVV